jgi:ABC-2 type transport system permease protein
VTASLPESNARDERARRLGELPFTTVTTRPGLFRGAGTSLIELWNRRELLSRLVGRETKARYKDSSLGLAWALVRPLMQLVVYYFAIGEVLGAARNVPNFAIFLFIGLTTWTLWSEILSGCTTSILTNAGLVKKIYLPREIFPLSAVGSGLVNFCLQSVVLIAAIFTLSEFRADLNLLLIPLALVTLIVFATAVGLFLSALNVYLRDVQHFVEVYLVVFFWVSPIVYPYTLIANLIGGMWIEQLYLANPVTICIIAMQKALWADGTDSPTGIVQTWPEGLEIRLLVMLAVSLIILFLAQRLFARLQGNFAQEI